MRRGLIKSGEKLPKPNTFIGGLGAHITTAEQLRLIGFITIPLENIKYFNVDGSNNIEAHIDWNYNIHALASRLVSNFSTAARNSVTYFFDTGGFCTSYGNSSFQAMPNITAVYFESFIPTSGSNIFQAAGNMRYYNGQNMGNNGGRPFASTKIGYHRLENCSRGAQMFYQAQQVKRIFIGNMFLLEVFADQSTFWHNITGNPKIYHHPDNSTSNDGELQSGLAFAQNSRGCTLQPVLDQVNKPNAVNDLSASDIATTSVKLNFTAPSSVNALEFYEVYVTRLDGTKYGEMLGKFIFGEVAASGGTLTGLASGVTYKIRIRACDIYWNQSEFSNEIEVTTL